MVEFLVYPKSASSFSHRNSHGHVQAGLQFAVETDDFDALASAAVAWDQRYHLLQPGRFRGRDRFAQTSRVQFSDPHFGLRLQAVGAVPAETITVAIEDHEGGFNLNGAALDQRQLIVCSGGAMF